MANIGELQEEVKLADPESLLKRYPHTSVLQRLGYLIEFVEPENNLLKTVYGFLESERIYPVVRDINDKNKPGSVDNRWKVDINIILESDI